MDQGTRIANAVEYAKKSASIETWQDRWNGKKPWAYSQLVETPWRDNVLIEPDISQCFNMGKDWGEVQLANDFLVGKTTDEQLIQIAEGVSWSDKNNPGFDTLEGYYIEGKYNGRLFFARNICKLLGLEFTPY